MNEKKKNPILTVIMIIALIVLVFSCYKIITQLSDYLKSSSLYRDLTDEYVQVTDVTEATETEASERETTETESDEDADDPDLNWPALVSVNFEELYKVNQDVCGWLYFENEDINYPIAWSGDDSTYLRTSLDGKHATAGTLFVEGKNTNDFMDSHTIIYGHNMHNLSMFGKLKYYYQDDDYYESHQYFQIATEHVIYRYRIFAYEITTDSSYVYTVGYHPDDAFEEFIQKLESDSLISTDIPVDRNDKIITLSTCTKDDGRFVVHAVLVDQKSAGETE